MNEGNMRKNLFCFLILLAIMTILNQNGFAALPQPAPVFHLDNVNELVNVKKVRLMDHVGKKPKEPWNIVLLSFYATWCKPCQKELQILKGLYQKFSPNGLHVLLYSIDEESKLPKLKEMMKEQNVEFPVLYDFYTKNVVANRYIGEQLSLPGIFVISKEGQILYEQRGEKATLEQELTSIIETQVKKQKNL